MKKSKQILKVAQVDVALKEVLCDLDINQRLASELNKEFQYEPTEELGKLIRYGIVVIEQIFGNIKKLAKVSSFKNSQEIERLVVEYERTHKKTLNERLEKGLKWFEKQQMSVFVYNYNQGDEACGRKYRARLEELRQLTKASEV